MSDDNHDNEDRDNDGHTDDGHNGEDHGDAAHNDVGHSGGDHNDDGHIDDGHNGEGLPTTVSAMATASITTTSAATRPLTMTIVMVLAIMLASSIAGGNTPAGVSATCLPTRVVRRLFWQPLEIQLLLIPAPDLKTPTSQRCCISRTTNFKEKKGFSSTERL